MLICCQSPGGNVPVGCARHHDSAVGWRQDGGLRRVVMALGVAEEEQEERRQDEEDQPVDRPANEPRR